MNLKNFNKKAAGAANLIIAITVLIIIYILFLPPQDRANLLGEGTTVTTPSTTTRPDSQVSRSSFVLDVVPGTIDYSALNEIDIPLNSFTLINNIEAQVLEEYNPFHIKNGIGDRVSKNLTLNLPNLINIENVQLSFRTRVHKGVLTITVNGNTVYQFDINTQNPAPVNIKKSLLSTQNNIEFSVSGVGFRFWETNEYSFEDVKIIADVADTSRQTGLNTFFITKEQANLVERARLRFNPDCNRFDVGNLIISINDRTVFAGVPDCGSPNFIDFAPNYIYTGRNSIVFKSEKGSYLIDLINLRLDLEKNQAPIYYFELDRDLFVIKRDMYDTARCGEIDGICPSNCNENVDYDCCMKQYSTPYWCVAMTDNINDRCVGFVNEDNYHRCPTMYVDRNGRIADFEINGISSRKAELCGDNHDGICPPGCSIYEDKDCCFDQSGDQFWCDSMPLNGLTSRCLNSVSLGQCDICPTKYIGERRAPICGPDGKSSEIEELKSDKRVLLSMKFTNDANIKKADIYVNGHLTRLDTGGLAYQRDISNFVEPGSNSIEIIPFSELNIRELKVEVK